MKTSGISSSRVAAWTGLAASALLACADQPSTTAAPSGVAVPMMSAATDAPGTVARLWRGGSIAPAPAATAAASAITLVGRLAPSWGAPRGTAALVPIATLPVGGGDVVRLRQEVDGIPVDGGELRVLVGPGGRLLAASGVLVPADLARDRAGFVLDATAAVGRAVHAVHGVDLAPALRARRTATAATAADGEAWFDGATAEVTVEEARARRRWHRAGDALVPAWVVEAYTATDGSTDGRADRVVIAARDGRVLAQRDLTVDAFEYRVWAETGGDRRPLDGPVADFTPHPTGAPGAGRPAVIAPALVSVDGLNHPAGGAAADPWLAAGATETSGNNVDAYTDINPPGGLTEGDFRAGTTAAGVFDRTYDTAVSPLISGEQQRAAITQLFYSINWLHDDWYDAGFTEAAGNGQADNYGRGGVPGDALRAEAQDGANDGNRNNANMSTPDDGMSPRMQVYLWSGPENRILDTGNRSLTSRGAAYGPADYDLVGTLVLAGDGAGASPADGCEPLQNPAAIAGHIALLERGNCTGKRKAENAQAAGATGLIISHNVAGSSAPGLPDDTSIGAITIPVMSVGFADGAALRADLANGPVTVTMHRDVGAEADGALDASLVAHEFGHYVHHRLSLCGTRMCSAMSEGWGDFIALLTMARPGDDLRGAFPVSSYAYNADPYFGIRRAPYSVDTTKNAFTFRLVVEGEPLPTGHPILGGGSNAEVHNAGEIWAEALWEVYVALQTERGAASFDEIRRKMMRYVVAGLLMAPTDASFTEMRDAILAAVQAQSPADHAVMAAAFARRGLGSCALSPDRNSSDFVGAVENFEVKGHALAGAVAFAIDVENCDQDGVLDVGETATLSVPIVNAGAVDLSGVTVTVTSATPGLTVLSPGLALGPLASYASTSASFQLRLDAATGPAAGDVTLTIASPGGCTETRTIPVPLRLAADDRLEASASDDFNASVSPWTLDGGDSGLAWNHDRATALDGFWRGTDLGNPSDTRLVSPALVAGSGAVTVAFDHSFEFEFSDQYYDGGVIELSIDGAAWVDASTLTTVPYNAMIGPEVGSDLAGQPAFSDKNPSWPARDRVTLDFGTQLAGKTIQLRFRIGTDQSVGAPGWQIDNLVTTGLTNTPFPVLVADDDACGVEPPGGGDDGGCCSTGGAPRGGEVLLGLGVAALLIRRRRRAGRGGIA